MEALIDQATKLRALAGAADVDARAYRDNVRRLTILASAARKGTADDYLAEAAVAGALGGLAVTLGVDVNDVIKR